VKIALFNQFFWPDQAATSQLLTDLARQLARDGHEVSVICGVPGYAGADAESRPPVTILSSPGLPFSRGVVARLGSYLSYLGSAAWRTLTLGRVDVVITMTTPPMVSLLGNLAKALHGAHHIVWEMDVYPEVAIEVGMIRRGSLVARALLAISHRSRNYADRVWVLGECMRRRMLDAGCPPERIEIHENWSHADLYSGPGAPAPDRLTLLYSGNLGLTHDVATLQGGLLALRDDARIRVQIAGGGPKRGPLEAFVRAEGLTNIEFLPYCSMRELGRTLSAADIGLVTLQDGCEGAVVPSKVYGLMACGRPILFIGPAASTPAEIIRKFGCGWRLDCGDVDGLVSTLKMLVARPDVVREAGSRGRTAFLEHYDGKQAVERLARAIVTSSNGAKSRLAVSSGRQATEPVITRPDLARQALESVDEPIGESTDEGYQRAEPSVSRVMVQIPTDRRPQSLSK
jgi:colanic acid biosynthesis glycosyl transferase WcaI